MDNILYIIAAYLYGTLATMFLFSTTSSHSEEIRLRDFFWMPLVIWIMAPFILFIDVCEAIRKRW